MKKTILITGSTDGIGKDAAEKLAIDGHQIIIHGRNSTKVQHTVETISQKTSNSDIIGYTADLSALHNIDQLSDDIKTNFNHIDVLINNAGVFHSQNSKNDDGIDLRLFVNYIAPFYLTQQLLALLQKSKDPRIINLSSAAQDSVSLRSLQGLDGLSAQQSYAQSKLALTMWSFDLGSKMSDISVIPVNPGSLLNTKMVQEAYGRFWSPVEKGSNILYLMATDNQFLNTRGKYFDNDLGDSIGDFGQAHPDAYDDDKIADLMKTTIQLIDTLSNK